MRARSEGSGVLCLARRFALKYQALPGLPVHFDGQQSNFYTTQIEVRPPAWGDNVQPPDDGALWCFGQTPPRNDAPPENIPNNRSGPI
jgi:hypothetical protein